MVENGRACRVRTMELALWRPCHGLGEQSHIVGYGAQQWGQVRILPCAPSGMEQEEGLWAWPGFWDMDQSPMVWYGVTSECQSVTKARGVHTGHSFPTCPILAPQEILQQT